MYVLSDHVIVQQIDDLVTQLDSVIHGGRGPSSFKNTLIVSVCLKEIDTKLNNIREINDFMARLVGTSTTSYIHPSKLANKNGDFSGK